MKTLITYDETGYVLSNITGFYKTPVGVPFLEVEIPQGKRLKITDGIGVDVSVTPHQVILEDIPPTEIEVLKQKQQELELTLDSLLSDVIPAILMNQQ